MLTSNILKLIRFWILSILDFDQCEILSIRDFDQFGILSIWDFVQIWILSHSGFRPIRILSNFGILFVSDIICSGFCTGSISFVGSLAEIVCLWLACVAVVCDWSIAIVCSLRSESVDRG